MRSDGWPETRADGPITNHSNVYVGFARGDTFMGFDERDGLWLDGEALAAVRDKTRKPKSYYQHVLELQGGHHAWSVPVWKPVTYTEVHDRNVEADRPDVRGVQYVAEEIRDLVRLDEFNGLDEAGDSLMTNEQASFTLQCDNDLFRVSVEYLGGTSTTVYFEGLA